MPSFFAPVIQFFQTKFSGTSSVTVANSTAAVSVIPVGVGNNIIPANWFSVGGTIRFYLRGTLSTLAVLPGNLTVAFKLNSTTIATGTGTAFLVGASNSQFVATITITARTIGTTGTVVAMGESRYPTTLSQKATIDLMAPAPITIDTTIAQTLDCTVQWSTASASNTITGVTTTIEQLLDS